MASKEEMVNRFLTKEGIEAINNRAKTFCNFLNKNKFPVNEIMLGFGKIQIESPEECICRISEISDLTGFKCKLTKINDGQIKFVAEY